MKSAAQVIKYVRITPLDQFLWFTNLQQRYINPLLTNNYYLPVKEPSTPPSHEIPPCPSNTCAASRNTTPSRTI